MNDDFLKELDYHLDDYCSDMVKRISHQEDMQTKMVEDVTKLIQSYYLIYKILKKQEAEIEKLKKIKGVDA